jgi:hypothetical protein
VSAAGPAAPVEEVVDELHLGVGVSQDDVERPLGGLGLEPTRAQQPRAAATSTTSRASA